MIVTLIIICEAAFWVLLAVGLALRWYCCAADLARAGGAVLLCELCWRSYCSVVTAIDLKNGAEPDWKHGLAAVYVGFTATHGHYMVKWADGHAAHRYGGGPRRPSPRATGRRAHGTSGRWRHARSAVPPSPPGCSSSRPGTWATRTRARRSTSGRRGWASCA